MAEAGGGTSSGILSGSERYSVNAFQSKIIFSTGPKSKELKIIRLF